MAVRCRNGLGPDGAWGLPDVGKCQTNLGQQIIVLVKKRDHTCVFKAGHFLFAQRDPVSAKDILSGEALSLEGESVELTVPAGSMRFVDIELR